MFILGITGNIGCGKSSLSNLFRLRGIDIIDADIVSRNIFEDKNLLDKVFLTFGDKIKNDDGSLNRKALGEIVFNNNKELVKLNNITHPEIKKKIKDKIEEYKRMCKKIIAIDGALLIECGYLDIIDKLVFVKCDENVQIQRVLKRDNCTREEALSRINSQISQKEKIKYSDYIIDNSMSIENLEKQANQFIDYIKENWCD